MIPDIELAKATHTSTMIGNINILVPTMAGLFKETFRQDTDVCSGMACKILIAFQKRIEITSLNKTENQT
jgi:hypothetical protein